MADYDTSKVIALGERMGMNADVALQMFSDMLELCSFIRLDAFGLSSAHIRNLMDAADGDVARKEAFKRAVLSEVS